MATIPSLPPPPLAEQAVTNPWPIVAILVLAGLVAFFAFNAKGKAVRGLAVAGVCLALGLVVTLVAFLVVTDREVLRARSASLTAMVAGGDGAGVRTIVHPTVKVSGSPVQGLDRAQIVAFVQRIPTEYAVTDHHITRIEAAKDGPEVARTHVYVRVQSDIVGAPVPMVVLLDWQRIDNTWWVVGIEPHSIPGVR